jgi:hypothetical protein
MVVAKTTTALSRQADQQGVVVAKNSGLARVRVGSLASIGSEIMRVDAIVATGSTATVTLGRGCLDTVPQSHAAGVFVSFWGDVAGSDRVEHFEFEAVSVKLLTRTNRGTLKVASAPTDVVTFGQRAIRPYPPGNLQINGGYADVLAVGDLTITWVGRDRTLQTTSVFESHTAGNIGPEGGVTYRVRAVAVDDLGAEVLDILDADVGAATSFTFDLDDYQFDAFLAPDAFALADAFGSILPPSASAIKIEVRSFRAGIECWQAPQVRGLIFRPPQNVQVFSPDEITFLAPANLTITEIL